MPSPEEEIRALTDRVNAVETALVALIQAQDGETKRRLTGIAQQLFLKFSERMAEPQPPEDLIPHQFEEAFNVFLDLIARALGRDWLRH